MLVQTIATKYANSVYTSHMKKTPFVLMYVELTIVTVLSYFIFVYSIKCAYLYSMKIYFVKKWYVVGHCKCHFVFQHTKIHEEELNLKKKFTRTPL
jgi:presenilin-like A22 family membrane protease